MSEKKFKKNQLSKWTLRAIAFFIAVTLWFYVVNSEPVYLDKKIPLNFLTPEGLVVANSIDWSVAVKTKGSRAFMHNIFQSGEKIEINLTTYDFTSSKPFDVTIGANDIPVPFGVEVLEVEPSSLEIVLEEEMTKSVDVHPQFIGSLPSGLNFIKQELEPSQVQVTGPRSMIRGLDRIRTTPIDLTSLSSSGTLSIRPQSPDPRIHFITDDALTFSFEVRPQEANITLTNIPVHFLTSAKRFEASQRHVALDIMVPESREKRLRRSEVRVIGEISEGSTGNVSVNLTAELPEGVFLLKIHPKTIDVVIEQ